MKTKKNPNAVALGRLGGKARAEALSDAELSAIGRKAGRIGGKARLEKLTPEQRSAIARKAAAASAKVRRANASKKAAL